MKDERTVLDVASVGDAEGVAALVGLDAPTADASLEARAAMAPIGDAFARLGKHLADAHRCMNGVHVCDIEEQEEAIKAAVAAYAEIQTVRARYTDASDIGKRAYLALDAYRTTDSWLAVVRAVDASRPAAAIERTLNINALARCARAALRIEVPDVVAWEALPEAERVGWRAVVRCILASTTLASRPGLTEEQAADLRERAAFIAETCHGGDHTISNRDLIAQRIRALPLRASRGTTGLTEEARHDRHPDGTRDRVEPPDPRATLHDGNPESPFAPGSLAAGSATEDRILDRKRGGK